MVRELSRDLELFFRWAPGQADHTAAHLAAALGAVLVTDDSDGVVDLGDALEIAGVGLSEGVVVSGALRGLLG
jgi:hypothetical protein